MTNITESENKNSELVDNQQEIVTNQQQVEANVDVTSSAEKLLTQTQVNDIVGKVRSEARKNALQDIEKTFAASSVSQPTNIQQSVTQQKSALSEEDIKSLIKQEAEAKAINDMNNRIAMEFVNKLEAAKSKYPDFAEETAALNIGKVPMNVVNVLNSVDNIDDVLHDISSRCPEKFTEIVNTALWSPELAQKALSKLSNSIKENQKAENKEDAKPPLSHAQPSISGMDNGKMSIRDLRQQPWLRG